MVRQLGEGVGTLRRETGNLVSALKRPATRGSWGEIQLRNVVEMAGMVNYCDFLEQSTIQTSDGALRPDMLVKLPGEKLVVVDSKVPLDAYLSSLEAERDDEREAHAAPPLPPDTRAHRQARLEGLPASVRLDARVRGDVRALRRHLPGGPRAGPRADRVRRLPAGADGDADDADRAAVGGPLRLAPGADRRVGPRDRQGRARAAPAPGTLRRRRSRRPGASCPRRSPPTTKRSARSTRASCRRCGASSRPERPPSARSRRPPRWRSRRGRSRRRPSSRSAWPSERPELHAERLGPPRIVSGD